MILYFYILSLCESNCISSTRLMYLIYLLGKMENLYKFKYKITARGINCGELDTLINEVINSGYATQSNKGLVVTAKGEQFLYDFQESYDVFERFNSFENFMSRISTDNLRLIVVSDIILEDLKGKDFNSLLDRDKVESIVSRLTVNFTSEDFDFAVGILRRLKEGSL